MNRGSYVRICVAAGPAVASMRPRFMNRGSIDEFADGLPPSPELQ